MLGPLSWSDILMIVFFAITTGIIPLVKRQIKQRDDAIAEIKRDCAATQASVMAVERDIAMFKQKVASEYATQPAVAAAQRETQESIRGVYERLNSISDQINDKFSDLLQTLVARGADDPPRRPRRS